MNPTQAIFWKEWRQIQWRWIFCLVMNGLLVIVGFKTRVFPDEAVVVSSFLIGSFLLPLFIGMGLITEEREQGCLKIQMALPITARRIYTIKMVMGVLAVITPIAASLVIALIMTGNREQTASEIILMHVFSMLFGAVYTLWIVVLSIRRKTQWAAAITGLAILAVWAFLVICDDIFANSINRARWSISLIITPFGFLEAGSDHGKWLATAIVQGILSTILFWWGMRRFSTLARSGK